MKAYQMGDFLRQCREQKGMSQTQLCRGICNHTTLSRIETGKQDPSCFLLKKLLQRLGVAQVGCQVLMNAQEFEISELQREIVEMNIYKTPLEALEKLNRLEQLCANLEGPDRTLVNQFILRSRALAGYLEEGQHKYYTFSEQRAMLWEILQWTCPGISLENIFTHLLDEEETKILNQLAMTYSEEGDVLQAIEIYRQLMKYIQSNFSNCEVQEVMLPLTAYNYSTLLGREHRWKESIAIAELGRRCCVRRNKCRMLGGLLLNLACCFHDLGEDEKSKELLVDSYYAYKIMEIPESCDLVKSYAKKTFQMEIG